MDKQISFLIETELDRAEVILAAKSITDTIQKMAEQVAKMDAEDVMPLAEPIRTAFGPEQSKSFGDNVSAKLRELTEQLKATKEAIDAEIARMEGEANGDPMSNDLADMDDASDLAPQNDDMNVPHDSDMADSFGAGDGADDMGAMSDMTPDTNALPAPDDDLSNMAPDMNAAGRARKESYVPTKKVLESVDPDRELAREFMSMIREGKSVKDAAATITEAYGIPVSLLTTIVESFRK